MTILIENFSFKTILGILDHERRVPQTILIDCLIDYTYENGHFINYAEVVRTIESIMEREAFELIETALHELSQQLKIAFPLIEKISITIRKPNILPNCTVGVQKNFIF